MNFIVLYVLPVLVGMMFVGIIFALEEISK
jgi:hypothetical protein